MTFCMHELAKDAAIQSKVHEEIDSVLERHGGEITYESVTDMKYLEACIDGKFVIFIQKIIRLISNWNR